MQSIHISYFSVTNIRNRRKFTKYETISNKVLLCDFAKIIYLCVKQRVFLFRSVMTKESVFSQAYSLYYRKCIVFALSYTHDMAQAEDIVAEAMIVLWEKLCGPEEIDNILPFLLGTIRNKILMYFRRETFKLKIHSGIEDAQLRELQLRVSSLEECNPQELYDMDIQSIVKESLEAMGSQTKKVFLLSRLEHKTNKEIAQELGIGIKGVEYHMTKALKLLRKNLKDVYVFLDILLVAAVTLPPPTTL